MLVCDICGRSCKSLLSLITHLRRSHKTKHEDYLLQTKYNGNPPTCKCGCGNKTNYFRGEFREFLHGHFLRVNANILLNEKVKEKRKNTNQERYGGNSPSCCLSIREKYVELRKHTVDFVKKILQNSGFSLLSDYKNNNSDIIVKCMKCNYEYKTKYSYIQQGYGCRKCGGTLKKETSEILEICKNKNIEILNNSYKNLSTLCDVKCLVCGYLWSVKFRDLIYKNSGCRNCYNHNRKQRVPKDKIIEELKNKNIEIIGEYTKVHDKHKLLCCLCGTAWETKINTIRSGHGCPTCGQTKRKKTNLDKYGVEHSLQNREIALKNARSHNKSCILYHWKTNEELICTASYEKKVVEFLNKNQIEYDWQPKVFNMPDEHTYSPDLYLPEGRLWVEIKGYMRERNRIKWEWFHNQYPNSELWNKEELKELGIL